MTNYLNEMLEKKNNEVISLTNSSEKEKNKHGQNSLTTSSKKGKR